ncbi:hypothetical protein NEK97_09035 [Paenarthrobacter sp. UW852]|uniref:hypothetical protein n=1 Tax=Paenarthrobacter sp. UW852 TaxID=2951989 RepID=UPI00214749F6|nr:hypothetical protein [Paenarthrobacter sp. UW852]MCR1161602.1 hypothetical protein [Paenarthrobacter sp. UW852]
MPHEPKNRHKTGRILAAVVFTAIALSACTPTTTENPMTGSNNPSDPATVKAQVEELKQALTDLHAFKTETQQTIGTQKWEDKNLRNSSCTTDDGKDGVNYRILSQTLDPVDLEASVEVVKKFWESRGFTTRVETNPKDPGLIDLYANQNGGHLVSFTANVLGSSLGMDTVCVAGDQHAIYKELDRQEASAAPTETGK